MGAIVCADGIQAMGATLCDPARDCACAARLANPFSAVINSALKPFAADGSCRDPQVAQQLAFVAEQVVEFAHMRRLHDATDPIRNARRHPGGENPQGSRLIELTAGIHWN